MICVSFYATLLLPKEQKITNDDPKITLFTAPRPFTGLIGERQALAVRSWLGLSENINVVLFSQDPSVFSLAESLGSRVLVEPNIDFTFLATPFFHSMVARSLASSSDVSVLVDPDTIILSDFVSTLNYAHKLDEDWLLIGATQNISHFPFHLDSSGKRWLTDDGKHVGIKKFQEFFSQKSCGKLFGEGMIIAWNNGDLPLHKGILPPFLYGKGLHNQWIITEALNSDFRLVIDASLTISSFYLKDIHQEKLIASTSWELNGNSLLGRLYGSFSFRKAKYSSLLMLFEYGGYYLFVNKNQHIAYILGYKRSLNFWKKGISVSPMEEEMQGCLDSIKSLEEIEGRLVNEQSRLWTSITLPLSLENLLSFRADQNKTIVLGVAGYSYKDMLMSWGLPVIKFLNPPTNISFDDCHFGTECFQKVTKVKSRMVLQILKLGYNVLLSDVDVYWFEDPLPYLRSFGPAVLLVQSDEYNTAGPINLPRRLNSGFYYAHSDIITIKALEKVVKHAANSNFSEQPSFYDTLCGEGGSNRLDDNQCVEPETNLLVHFLNRDIFPNGAYGGLWEEKNIKKICMDKGCLILHNNWISGRKKKLERQVLSGLWEYDINTRMCLQSWQRMDIPSYF